MSTALVTCATDISSQNPETSHVIRGKWLRNKWLLAFNPMPMWLTAIEGSGSGALGIR